MSSNRIERSISLDNGVTPRRLNHVVLPEPGRPMVNTTKPRDGRGLPTTSGGGSDGDSGCVSTTSLPSLASLAAVLAGERSGDSPPVLACA
jgi:hypothetical protein